MMKRFNDLFFPNEGKADYFQALNGFRGLAAICVMLSHASRMKIFFHESLDFYYFRVGKPAVFIFFILSAYLLSNHILKNLKLKRINTEYWITHIVRKIHRVYPLLLISLMAHWALTEAGVPSSIPDWKIFVKHILLIVGHDQFWFMVPEFKHYVISPLILLFCWHYLKMDLKKISVFLLVLTIVTMYIHFRWQLNVLSYFRYTPLFLSGMFIAVYEYLNKQKLSDPAVALRNELIGILGWVAAIAFIIFYRVEKDSAPVYYLIYSLLWGMVLLGMIYGKGYVGKVFESRFFSFFGTISFCIYASHYPILRMIHAGWFNIPYSLQIYVFFIVSILTSVALYIFVEKPLSKIDVSGMCVNVYRELKNV